MVMMQTTDGDEGDYDSDVITDGIDGGYKQRWWWLQIVVMVVIDTYDGKNDKQHS